jgi:hypothetical protein
VAEYNEHMRTLKYTHPDTQPDDALHSTNYSLLMAGHMPEVIDDIPTDESARPSGIWADL